MRGETNQRGSLLFLPFYLLKMRFSTKSRAMFQWPKWSGGFSIIFWRLLLPNKVCVHPIHVCVHHIHVPDDFVKLQMSWSVIWGWDVQLVHVCDEHKINWSMYVLNTNLLYDVLDGPKLKFCSKSGTSFLKLYFF